MPTPHLPFQVGARPLPLCQLIPEPEITDYLDVIMALKQASTFDRFIARVQRKMTF